MSTEAQIERPEIFRYLDYRHFLQEYFEYLAKKNSKFSRRWVALKAGLKSPQLISMIIKGERKLNFENAQLLSLAFSLSEKEEEYLLTLLELENAKNRDQQLAILDRIKFQFQNGLFKDLPDTGYEYIRKWYYSAIRELCAVKDFSVNPKNIARALELTEAEAIESLELLVKLGYLALEDGRYSRREASIRAADQVSPLLMAQFHLQILERAFHACQLRREIRHFDSLVVAISVRDIDTVREKIRQLIREIDMLGESAAQRNDVFQLSVQFFSLTGGRAQEQKS